MCPPASRKQPRVPQSCLKAFRPCPSGRTLCRHWPVEPCLSRREDQPQPGHPERNAALGAQPKSRGSARPRRGRMRAAQLISRGRSGNVRSPSWPLRKKLPDSDGILRLHFPHLSTSVPLRMTDVRGPYFYRRSTSDRALVGEHRTAVADRIALGMISHEGNEESQPATCKLARRGSDSSRL